MLDLAAGNWKRSEELLTRSAGDAESAVVNYLVAARAADLQDAVARRDEWLARAQEAGPEERAPALVTLAEMQMRRGQHEAALATLEQLDASGDLNSRGLELMARLSQKLGRGELLRNLGPRLRSAKELPEKQVNELLAQAELEEIRALGERGDRGGRRSGMGRAAAQRPPAAAGDRAACARADGCRRACRGGAWAPRAHRRDRRRRRAAALWRARAAGSPRAARARGETGCASARTTRSCSRPVRSFACVPTSSARRGAISRRVSRDGRSADVSLLLADLLDERGDHAHAVQVLRDALAHGAGRRPGPLRARLRRR